MKESYLERMMREKFPFLYPDEKVSTSYLFIFLPLAVLAGYVAGTISFSYPNLISTYFNQGQTIPSDDTSISSDIGSSNDFDDVSTTTYKYENIVFQVVGNIRYSDSMKIFQDGKLVFVKYGGDFHALDFPSCPTNASATNCYSDSSPTFGVDINGNGNKDFVFADVSGGNGGYVSYDIFELPKGGSIKALVSLYGIPGEAPFKDLNGDGKLEVKLLDSTFTFWHTDHSTSPYPTVYLSWDKTLRTYIPDLDLMRKPPPSQAEITKQVNFYSDTDWCMTVQTPYGVGNSCSMPWSYALDLIYSGNATSAKKYLEAVWSFVSEKLINDDYYEFPTYATEKYLENELLVQLKQSPYYEDIFILNGGKIF